MISALERLDITPRRLTVAVQRAIELHPGTAVAPVALPSEGMSALRLRVAATGGERDQLDQLARELSPREVRGLVTGLEQWEEVRESVAHLLLARARASLVSPLWRAWQRFPSVEAVRSTLAMLADRFGWREAVGDPYAELVAGWVHASAPGVEIQGWLDGLGKSYSDLPHLSACPLASDTPLVKLVRDAILTHGSEPQLNTEGTRNLLEWNKELSPPQRMLFGRNYLLRIAPPEWNVALLEHVERTYGLPKRPRIPEFWQPLPESVRNAFQQYFVHRRLREAFGGNSDRYAYWKRWIDTLVEVSLDQAGGVDWALLRFERFGVIEFFEVGNAAYFYDTDRLDRITRSRAYRVADLKEQYYPDFTWGDNRLIHRIGWESTADEMVALWTQKAR